MILQLNPPIPVWVRENPDAVGVSWPAGKGYAMAWIDYSQEHSTLWKVAFDVGGTWDVPQPYVSLQRNASMERGS